MLAFSSIECEFIDSEFINVYVYLFFHTYLMHMHTSSH